MDRYLSYYLKFAKLWKKSSALNGIRNMYTSFSFAALALGETHTMTYKVPSYRYLERIAFIG
jgi:hypothetical protein